MVTQIEQPVVAVAPPPARRARKKRTLGRYLIPIGAIVVLIGLWEAVVAGFGIPTYIVPSPVDVAQTLVSEWGTLMTNLAPTAMETVLGFLLGNAFAILLAVVFVHSKPVERALFPVAIFIRTIPIVAIAPVLVIMFGSGYTPKIIIAALISFFPTLVNTVRGLESVDAQALELMRVLSATPREVLFRVRVFASLPYVFSALKIAATSAVIGAVVAEWIGADSGLGNMIVQATYNYRTAELYAAMVVTSLFASACFAVVGLAERLTVRWDTENKP
jgi:NitT/TauT family transport system permease protein